MEEEKEIMRIKMVFIGNENTGKTQIMNRFLQKEFESNYYSTIGLDFDTKTKQLKNNWVKFSIYDISGQKKFDSLIPLYLVEKNVFVLVYDITNKNSFLQLDHYLAMIKNRENVILALLGNKIDLEDNREVTKEEAENFANENLMLFFEVSAKSNEGINQFFESIIFSEAGRKFTKKINKEKE